MESGLRGRALIVLAERVEAMYSDSLSSTTGVGAGLLVAAARVCSMDGRKETFRPCSAEGRAGDLDLCSNEGRGDSHSGRSLEGRGDSHGLCSTDGRGECLILCSKEGRGDCLNLCSKEGFGEALWISVLGLGERIGDRLGGDIFLSPSGVVGRTFVTFVFIVGESYSK